MTDLSTKYMGLDLRNPIIAASSGLTDSVENVVKLEINGAGAVVLKSLFEEQIMMDIDEQRMNNMYGSYDDVENYIGFYTKKHRIDHYLELIRESKKKTSIPIIASINCVSASEWTEFASRIQEAGADALELNMFIMPSDGNYEGADIEQIYFDIVAAIKQHITIPVALKISNFFSGMANFAIKLSETGISSLVLFNRFYRPDVDLEKMKITSSHIYSNPDENAMVLRWIGILKGKLACDMAASTGIHDGETILKNLLVGANAVEVASAIYKNGMGIIPQMLTDMTNWMKAHNYNSVNELIGKLSQESVHKPMIYERAQFMKYFSDVK
ncbi:dihydroorotate dehydrogenase-like protein [Prolixibacter denitrificans]|uniref:Diguanylate cyclase n=1 Tax=Prolixibacter denitrificans TaxID=1541063 RepID=A0A2P8CE90_9BACT|nr:dihydroorotate dehydrogenase-like protein [Prolixibacter denitrificans]PSK83305.1 dihydroorotate dehydrogenase (fumarate) [Prolixibacter denitrificans]GET21812.1 diguanylate cyclase [Prolixibacter denitrificans]